jgi:hypothetical protein
MVEGDEPVAALAELSDWLGREAVLRGLVSPAPVVPDPGELWALADALVVAAGSGPARTWAEYAHDTRRTTA